MLSLGKLYLTYIQTASSFQGKRMTGLEFAASDASVAQLLMCEGVNVGSSARGRRIGVIGSHGAVGRALLDLLCAEGCEVICGNRTRRTPDEDTLFVDAHKADSVREFARGCAVVVNCAGPSCLIKDRVAAALPADAIYVDPFGGNCFEHYAGVCPSIINAGCTPGLAGLLTRHLAGSFDECTTAVVCCGGREQGGLAGFADVILSTRDGYGHPGQMLVEGRVCPHVESDWQMQDTASFPQEPENLRSPFVTDELYRVVRDCAIAQLAGFLVIPDQASLQLLLKAMSLSESGEPEELMRFFAQIDAAKSGLDEDRKNWSAMQVSARGHTAGVLERSSVAVCSDDSSELTAVVLAQTVLRALETGCPPGAHWAYRFLEVEPVMGALRQAGMRLSESGPDELMTERHQHAGAVESGFL